MHKGSRALISRVPPRCISSYSCIQAHVAARPQRAPRAGCAVRRGRASRAGCRSAQAPPAGAVVCVLSPRTGPLVLLCERVYSSQVFQSLSMGVFS